MAIPRVYRPDRGTAALESIAEQQAKQQKSSRTITYISLGATILTLIITLCTLLHSFNLI